VSARRAFRRPRSILDAKFFVIACVLAVSTKLISGRQHQLVASRLGPCAFQHGPRGAVTADRDSSTRVRFVRCATEGSSAFLGEHGYAVPPRAFMSSSLGRNCLRPIATFQCDRKPPLRALSQYIESTHHSMSRQTDLRCPDDRLLRDLRTGGRTGISDAHVESNIQCKGSVGEGSFAAAPPRNSAPNPIKNMRHEHHGFKVARQTGCAAIPFGGQSRSF